MKRPFCSGARRRSVPGRATPLRAAEPPAHPLRIRGDADGEPALPRGDDPVAAERDVADDERVGRPPASRFAGRVEGRELQRVCPLHRPAVDFPFQTIVLLGRREARQSALAR